jgi:predicted NAD-dependent protein-ADP-ribosyltransferase YbiA (DUF1768 family)
MESKSKRAITDHFRASTKTQQEVLAELPHVQAETIQFHSFSKSDGHSYLSNMFPCVRFHRYGLPRTAPFVDPKEGGMEFDSVERFYQYHRFLAIDERYANEVILPAKDAKAVATASGKRVYEKWWKQNRAHGDIGGERMQFEENDAFDRDEVMRKGLRLKFTQNAALKEALLATKDAPLEETGRFDGEYWTNKGKNRLGQLLMEVRDELRKVLV